MSFLGATCLAKKTARKTKKGKKKRTAKVKYRSAFR